jgi:glycolate oxidase FAD binding subunit
MLHPTSEADVVEAVRAAREARTPLRIEGAGTKREFSRPVSGDLLSTAKLEGIVDYRPEELILTVKPGTRVVDIAAALGDRNQRLGFDPPDWGPLFGGPEGAGTIAGALSADLNGPARVRYGAARDHLLGIAAVNGFGEAFKAGGKVVKNVTGFDLPKLVCGAFGTLCVLTEVTLRVFPKSEHAAVFAVAGVESEEGLALLRRAWSSPLEPTGLAYLPQGIVEEPCALIRLEGEPLEEKAEALLKLLGGARQIANGDALFAALGSGFPFVRSPLEVWRISLPPAAAAAFVAEARPERWYADWAGGLVWAGVTGIDLHPIATRHGGHGSLLLGNGTVAPFTPPDAARLALTRSVKAAFDPLGLFNPGRMYEGI